MTPFNNLRMELKEVLTNMWDRISGLFSTVSGRVDDIEGDMIKTISLNGVNVPKDSSGNVALQETDPTVPAWAKQAKAKTSDLTNDGADGINPFITALNLPQNTSDLTNDGDGNSPFATLQEMQSALTGQYALIDLHTKSQTSWLTIQEMWDELKKVPINENRAFSADSNCSDMISGGETLTLEGIIYPHGMNYTDTIDRYYYMAFDGLEAKIYLGEFNIGRHPVSGEYLCECLEIHTISDSGGGGGGSGAVNTVTFNGVVHQPDANGNVSFGFAEADPTVPAWAKAAQKPSYTADEVGAKPTQTAVADPTASGMAVAFIDSITQGANGVITPTKKTVRSASQSESGLMSATDKTKLDGVEAGAQVNSVTGVKGNAESSYRTGNVNLTPENLEAAASITLYQHDGSRADIWEEIKKIPIAKVGLIFITSAGCSILTRGDLTKWLHGLAVRTNATNVAIIAMEDSAMYTWSVTGFNTDAYTVGTIFKYTGTAI